MRPVLAALLVSALLAGCGGREPEGHAFVPGQPLQFPLRSEGVLVALGARLAETCRNPDAALEQACLARVAPRVESCRGFEPPVFRTREEYRAAGRRYGDCVMAP